MQISSPKNERIKAVIRLQKARERNRRQQTLCEGYRSVAAALHNGHPIDDLYFCSELFLGENETTLLKQAADADANLVEVGEAPFRKMSNRDRPEGLLAVVPQVVRDLDKFQPEAPCLILVAESIETPANLGMILRSADAAGADALFVCDRVTDVYHPDVIRSSVGAFFSVPIFDASGQQALNWCRQRQVRVLAGTPFASQLYTDSNMTGSVALVVGAEQFGLSELWMQQTDQQIRLPMLGQADSLNVAMAATLLLYEAVRQRQGVGLRATPVV